MPIWPDDNLVFSAMPTWTMVGKCGENVLLLSFTLVHIHIYPKLSFSIKTLHSNLLSCLTDQKERRFWLIPVNCGGFPLRLSVAAFESGAHQIYLLSWVGLGLLLFGFAKLIDLGLIPSRIDFGTQMRWAALGSLCWVLLWVHPQSLVLPGVVGVGTDGTHVFPVLLLWLNGWFASHPSLTFPFQKVFLFFWVHWVPFDRKPCPARICCGTHDGTDLALTSLWVPSFTASFFISDDVMIALDVKQAAGVDTLFRQADRCCWAGIAFVQIVVGGLTYLLWSLCLMC